MQENNEQVVTEEVKPVEVVPTEVQAAPGVQTVDVDQIVGNPVESNNNDMNNKNSRRSPRELVLIVIAALTMIASGVYFAFFNEDEEEASGNNGEAETVEKEDNKETTDDETNKAASHETKKEETASNTKLVKFYITEFNPDLYDYSVMKNLATTDTITEHDLSQEGKKIKYTFTIENKSVVVSNSYGSKYTISKIKNAKQLLVTGFGGTSITDSVFVVTEDNKLYAIRLYADSSVDQVITDFKELENTTTEESTNVKNISAGSYNPKHTTPDNGAILIEKDDNKKYVLTASEMKD